MGTNQQLPTNTLIQNQQVPPPQFPPVNMPQNITAPPPPKNPFLNRKTILILFLLAAVIAIIGVGVYFFIVRNSSTISSLAPAKNSLTNQNISIEKLKDCNVVKASTDAPETSLEAKFVLSVRDDKKEETRFLDLNTNKVTTLDPEDSTPLVSFSPNGQYIVYIQDLYPEAGRKVVKFFLYDIATDTRKQFNPSFEVDTSFNQSAKWANDSKQFIITQQGGGGKKDKDGTVYFEHKVNYFYVTDLVPREAKTLATALGKSGVYLAEFPKENEIIFFENKSTPLKELKDKKESDLKYEFSKANLLEDTVKPSGNFSFKLPIGVTGQFSPDYKYYVFTEREQFDPSQSTSSNSVDNKNELFKKLKAYVGYINLEDKCSKKIEITQIPIYFNTEIKIEQFSEDNKKVLLKINSLDISNNAEILQYWRMDIASLTKPEKGVNTNLSGDQINSVTKISSNFNYALVHTIGGKSYILNYKTGETTLIATDPPKVTIYSSWLQEKLK